MMTKPPSRRWWPCLSLAAGLVVFCWFDQPKDQPPSREPPGPARRLAAAESPTSSPAREPGAMDASSPMVPDPETPAGIPPFAARVARLSFAERLAKLLEMLQGNGSLAEREDFLTEWLAELTRAEVPSALVFLQNAGLSEALKTDLTTRLARRWAEDDVYAATDWVNALPASEGRALALEGVAIVRANRDLNDTSTWARALPDGPERDRVIFAVANEAVRAQPRAALDLAAELPDGPAGEELVRRAATEYAGQDEAGAMEWARQLADPGLRARVMAGVAVAWSERDPQGAAALAVRELPEGRTQNDAIVGIVARWSQTDPGAAVAWVNLFPTGELQRAATDNIATIHASRAGR